MARLIDRGSLAGSGSNGQLAVRIAEWAQAFSELQRGRLKAQLVTDTSSELLKRWVGKTEALAGENKKLTGNSPRPSGRGPEAHWGAFGMAGGVLSSSIYQTAKTPSENGWGAIFGPGISSVCK